MDDALDDPRRTSTHQLLRRVDKMLEAGRISEDDAARLWAAAESGGLDEAIAEVRRKHVEARVLGAVESHRLSSEEATAILGRLEDGEDPRRLVRGLQSPRQGRDTEHPKGQEPHDG
jgi:aconitase B